MKNVLLKDTAKEIKNTFKRFLSILLVVLLGVGFFAGIKAASPDMKMTVDKYFDDQNVMDIQVMSTLGLTDEDIDTIKNVEGVENAQGTYSQDVIVTVGDEEAVIKMETISSEMNDLVLVEGKLPENIDECVVEESFLSWSGNSIGDTITINAEKITNDNGEEKDVLKQNTMKIVGIVKSPLYISRERGSSKLGSGKINYYMYISKEAVTTDIYTNVYVTSKGAKELATYKDEYEDLVDSVKDNIEKISEERKQARYNEIYDEANSKIQDTQKILNEEKEKAEKEIQDAEEQIADAKKEIEDGRTELSKNRQQVNTKFAKAEKKLEEAEKELNTKIKQFETAKNSAQKEIKANKEKLSNLKNVQTQYNTAKTNLSKKQKELTTLNEKLAQLDPNTDSEEISNINSRITTVSQEIYVLNATITGIENSLTSQGLSSNKLSGTIKALDSGIKEAESELEANEEQLNNAQKELQKQRTTLSIQKSNTYVQLNSAENKLNDGEKEIEENEKKLEDAKKEADEKIADAEEELEEAKLKLDDIKKPEWYVLDRNQNTGYASYMQDSDRIANIATVFPVVFFVVATLISLTSMSRMVEEERVQIGTLKALGYTKLQIASKYIIYAVLATIIGSLIGLEIGYNMLPRIVISMYAMMYELPEPVIAFNTTYTVISVSLAMLCTVGATIYSCAKELRNTPANLMRPKAPKAGKRVLLEKIPFIWSRFSFTQKVTARNMFRYKKRFLMTIIGVMGSTALILAGFGIRDSITQMIPSQYGEIFKYNVQVSLKDSITTRQIDEKIQKISDMDEVQDIIKVNMQAIEITSIENTQNIQLIVPENVDNLSNFIVLKSRIKKNEIYTLDSSGVIITEKLAKVLDLKVGDNIKIKNTDDVEVEIKISNITENYLMHYMYMSPELYESLYQEDFKANAILVNMNDTSKEEELGRKILQDSETVSSVVFTSSTENMFSEIMDRMNLVVWILIISAGLLAFVVLYNLSNTNISERIRELATIKVLGFYDKEVYDYVSKETTILTAIGIIIGLFVGVFLGKFIVNTCELDILMFDKKVNFISYIYSIVITIVFAMIVNMATYFALKKIDMIESLKSVEQ